MVCENKNSTGPYCRASQNWSLDSEQRFPIPVSLHCTANSIQFDRMHCKRQWASLLTMLTDWKRHQCSSTSLHCRARVITQWTPMQLMNLNKCTFDLGVAVILTVTDAFGLYESNMPFCVFPSQMWQEPPPKSSVKNWIYMIFIFNHILAKSCHYIVIAGIMLQINLSVQSRKYRFTVQVIHCLPGVILHFHTYRCDLCWQVEGRTF